MAPIRGDQRFTVIAGDSRSHITGATTNVDGGTDRR
jgi:hypothetical protein